MISLIVSVENWNHAPIDIKNSKSLNNAKKEG